MLKLLSTIGTVAAVAVPTSVAVAPAPAPGYIPVADPTPAGVFTLALNDNANNVIGPITDVRTGPGSVGGTVFDFSMLGPDSIDKNLWYESVDIKITSLNGTNSIELPKSVEQMQEAQNQFDGSVKYLISPSSYASSSFVRNNYINNTLEMSYVSKGVRQAAFGFESEMVRFDGVPNEFRIDLTDTLYEDPDDPVSGPHIINTSFWVDDAGKVKSTPSGIYGSTAGATVKLNQ